MRRQLLFTLLLIALVVSPGAVGVAQQPAGGATPVIVVFHDDAPFELFRPQYRTDARMNANPAAWGYLNRAVVGTVQALESQYGFVANRVYSAALRGFAARLTGAQIAALANDPLVASLESDGLMQIVQGKGNGPGGGGGGGGQETPWGITRIGGFKNVTNVRAYIIDTGIDGGHRDLNVVQHVNFAGGQNRDCNGHGTHVAGTVAAVHNTVDVVGAAASTPLVGVKVLGCSGTGSTSGVIAGVDWVTANAAKPAVANMSLGGGASTALDTAVKNSANSGVFYAIAAGNSGANACNSSPARAGTHDGVLTVAATNQNDQEASWSNYGPCIDLWAPGVSILSTRNGGGTTTMSGTSMAAPHGGGTGARYLSANTGKTAAQVESALKTNAVSTGTSSKDGQPIALVSTTAF